MIEKPIVLLGEAPGEAEAKIGRSFVGPSGALLLQMLDDAHVISLSAMDRDYIRKYYSTRDPWCIDAVWGLHPELHRTNVFKTHPPGNELKHFCGTKAEGIPGFPALVKSGYVRKEFYHDLDALGAEILSIDPNLIIGLGNSALWALAGRTGITKVRGTTCVTTHTISGYKLLCTYHPAAIIRQWELRPTGVIDLAKAIKESQFPEVRRPACEIWIEPDLEDIQAFISQHIRGCKLLSVDIETVGSRITCIGFAPRTDLALVIPFDDSRTATGNYWPDKETERRCWDITRSVLEDAGIPKLFQNGMYDIAFLARSKGIRVRGAKEDTMLLHHALQPEALKALGYLGSIYTDHGPWKDEHRRGQKEDTIKRDA